MRRLAPALAGTCQPLLHERLPFGNWTSAALEDCDRAAARGAGMPPLYQDDSSKDEAQIAVKNVVWGAGRPHVVTGPGVYDGIAVDRIR